jgi:hypothetical protein
MRIVELCVYILIIIAAVIWLFTGGRLYQLPEQSPAVMQTEQPDPSVPPPIVIPQGDVFPGLRVPAKP